MVSASYQVDQGKEKDPDNIDEVPVEPGPGNRCSLMSSGPYSIALTPRKPNAHKTVAAIHACVTRFCPSCAARTPSAMKRLLVSSTQVFTAPHGTISLVCAS